MTRRQLAMAFWASVRIWVPIWTGPTNRVTRNANASTVPTETSPAKPSSTPDDQHAGVGEAGREATEGERDHRELLGLDAGRLELVDRGVDALLGAVLDGVGADHLGADDRLGDRREQHPDLAAYDGVGRGQLALEPADREEQRRERHPDDERELPAVEHHHHGGDQHLADADDEDQAAEHEELADLVDVGGHPRDQRPAALGVLGQQRQVVDVAERLDPERGQAPLGGAEQPARHQVGRHAGDHDGEGGEHAR